MWIEIVEFLLMRYLYGFYISIICIYNNDINKYQHCKVVSQLIN